MKSKEDKTCITRIWETRNAHKTWIEKSDEPISEMSTLNKTETNLRKTCCEVMHAPRSG
jgi:heme-degrading monooxygenase HmoA